MENNKNRDIYSCKDFDKALNSHNRIKDQASNINCDFIHHYTSLEILTNHILKDKTFKLSRLDLLNDLSEMKLSNSLLVNNMNSLNTFVSCFQADINESIPMWCIYARDTQLKFEDGIKAGVKISFPFESFFKYFNESTIYDSNNSTVNTDMSIEALKKNEITLSKKDLVKVLYDDKLAKKDLFSYWQHGESNDNDYQINFLKNGGIPTGTFDNDLCGLIKPEAWSYENEIRARIIVTGNAIKDESKYGKILPETYLLLKFDYNFFSTITITLNPFMDDDCYEKWKNIILKENTWIQEKQILRSILTGSIRF